MGTTSPILPFNGIKECPHPEKAADGSGRRPARGQASRCLEGCTVLIQPIINSAENAGMFGWELGGLRTE